MGLHRMKYHQRFDPCLETLTLLSALELADRNFPGGLKAFKTDVTIEASTASQLTIVKDSICEILRGMQIQNSSSVQKQWEVELSALLYHLLMRENVAYMEYMQTDLNPDVLCKLADYPTVSLEFFLELTKECELFDGLWKTLQTMPVTCTVPLVALIVKQIASSGGVKSFKLILKLFSLVVAPDQGLLTNCLRCETNLQQLTDVLKIFCDVTFLLKSYWIQFENEDTVELEWQDSIIDPVMAAGLTSACLNSYLMTQNKMVFICDKVLLGTDLTGNYDVPTILDKHRQYAMKELTVRNILHEEVIERLDQMEFLQDKSLEKADLAQTMKLHLSELHARILGSPHVRKHLNTFLQVSSDPQNVTNVNESMWIDSYILSRFITEFQSAISDKEVVPEHIQTLFSSVQTSLVKLSALRTCNSNCGDTEYNLQKVLFCIGEKFSSSSKCCEWLLENSCLSTHATWAVALENAAPLLTVKQICAVYDTLVEMSELLESSPGVRCRDLEAVHFKIKSTFLQCFAEFSADSQQSVMLHAFSSRQPCRKTFRIEDADFTQKLTSKLNKITSHSADSQQERLFLQDMAGMAIQNPEVFITVLVRNALLNEDQATILGKMTLTLPVIYQFRNQGKEKAVAPPLLFTLLCQTALQLESSKQLKHLKNFFRILLQIRRGDDQDQGKSSQISIFANYILDGFVLPVICNIFGDLNSEGFALDISKLSPAKNILEVVHEIFMDLANAGRMKISGTILVKLFYQLAELLAVFCQSLLISEWCEVKFLMRLCLTNIQSLILTNAEFIPNYCIAWCYKKLLDLKQWQVIVTTKAFIDNFWDSTQTSTQFKICAALVLKVNTSGLNVSVKVKTISKWKSKDFTALLCLSTLSSTLTKTVIRQLHFEKPVVLKELYDALQLSVTKLINPSHSEEWQVMCKTLEDILYETLLKQSDEEPVVSLCPVGAQVFFTCPCPLLREDYQVLTTSLTLAKFGRKKLARAVVLYVGVHACLLALKVLPLSSNLPIHVHLLKNLSQILQSRTKEDQQGVEDGVDHNLEVSLHEIVFVMEVSRNICKAAAYASDEASQGVILPQLMSLTRWCKQNAQRCLGEETGDVLMQVVNFHTLNLPVWLRSAVQKMF